MKHLFLTTLTTLALVLSPLAVGDAFQGRQLVRGVTSTATAAGTTTLTVSSNYHQRFTGSTTQTVVMPDATTLKNGMAFKVSNDSTGSVTVNANGGSNLATLLAGQWAEFFLTSNGSSAGTWDVVGVEGAVQRSIYSAKGSLLAATAASTPADLPIGTDGTVLVADSAQSAGVKWSAIQGGTNYVSNNGAESAATGCTAYADAAATSPVDGTGGSPTMTCTRTTSSPLVGVGSFLVTKDAANRQGEGVAFEFTIDRESLAKQVQVAFSYEVASGTYDAGSDSTDSDLTVWVYGPTDGTAVLTQLAPYKVLGASSGVVQRFQGNFQTASSGVAYRLILHEAKTGSSAYTLKFDNLSVAPVTRVYGAPVTDWVSWTPTGSWSSNTTYAGFRRRVGDSEEFTLKVSTSGAPTSANLTINLPVTIDTAKTSAETDNCSFGNMSLHDSGTAYPGPGVVCYASTTSVSTYYTLENGDAQRTILGQVAHNAPFTFASGDEVFLMFRVPVAGYSSTVQMGSDADTRIVAARYTSTSSGSVGTAAPVDYATKVYDTHNAVTTGASWRFIAPVPGTYVITAQFYVNGTPLPRIYKNGTYYSQGQIGSSTSVAAIRDSVSMVAGDYIDIRADGTYTLANNANIAFVEVHRLTGPSAIAANEKIIARCTSTAGPSTSAAGVVFNFASCGTDTHGAFTTGASSRFTFPVAGCYLVHVGLGYDTPGASITVTGYIRKNGTSVAFDSYASQSTGERAYLKVSDIVCGVTGDYVDVLTQTSSGTPSASTATGANFIAVTRIN